jgi:hypothetical protein
MDVWENGGFDRGCFSRPQLAVERAVLDGFGNVVAADFRFLSLLRDIQLVRPSALRLPTAPSFAL